MDQSPSKVATGPPSTYAFNTSISFPNRVIGKSNIHPVLLNGIVIQSMIDTGSQVSLMNESLYRKSFGYLDLLSVEKLLGGSSPKLRAVNGEVVRYIGAIEVHLRLGKSLAGTNDGVPVLFLILRDDVPGKPTHGKDFCLIGMNAIESLWPHWISLETPQTCMLDFAYSAFLRVQKHEHEKDAYLGKLKVADEIRIPPRENRSVKCNFRSKFVGMTTTVLLEPHPDCTASVQPAIRDVPLSALSRVTVPMENNTDA